MNRKALLIVKVLFGTGAALGALWWALFALKPYEVSPTEMSALYEHRASDRREVVVHRGTVERIVVGNTPAWSAELLFASFDGAPVVGRVVYPADPATLATAGSRVPVVLAMHAMGRTQQRWWHAELRGRPTIESTHLLAERALQSGYAVLALDARSHGARKDSVQPLNARKLLNDLHVWGAREPYERLVVQSVKDYRVLLDWVAKQPEIDAGRVRAAGYSMGAQMALLLAAMDSRVRSVAAMVPPHVDAKVAAVSPFTVASRLGEAEVWLLTADDDEHASVAENAELFAALPGKRKHHLTFEGGHVLPHGYVARLQPWLESQAASGSAGARRTS
jgi:dienelactone hydrolase